ncbi:MAG: FHA domain-containing protein [Deltaproteobacteria bacterium]|nr:FHA domain-containing protein [Deltaproteobacteria bacterium]
MTEVEKTVMFAMPNLLSGQVACIAGTAAGRSWDLSAGTFTIGRLDEHDLCLAQEPGVSKTHAKIIGQGDRYVLVDCESRNGTILNDTNVHKADLYDGDEIRICGCVLRFQQTGGPARPRKPPVEHTRDDAPAPRAPMPSPAATYTQPLTAPPIVVEAFAVPHPPPAPPPAGRGLARWYAAGLVASLVVGGAASGAMIATSPPAPVGPPAVPATPSPPPVAITTPPAVPALPAEAPVLAVVGAGVANASVDAGAPAVPEADAPTGSAPGAPATEGGEPDEEPNDVVATAPPRARPRREGEVRPAAPVAAAAAETVTYPAVVDGGGVEAVRTKTGGRVAAVDVADGATVKKGQTLLTFASGADPGEIQTLQDRIASLENAEEDEAKRDLRAAKTKLAALEGGRGAPPVVAPADGQLSGFNVIVGAVLRPGELVGKVGDGDVPTRVRVTLPQGVRVKAGQPATLVLKGGGTADGTVTSASGRSVVVDTGAVGGDAIEGVRF